MVERQFSQFEDHLTSVAALAHVKTGHSYGVDNAIWETLGYFADRPFVPPLPSLFIELPPLRFEDAERYLQWREITLKKARQIRFGHPIGSITINSHIQEAA